MLVRDHLNLTGRSPLSGLGPAGRVPVPVHRPHRPVLGPAAGAGPEADPSLAEGVYAAMPGPHYETPAEIRMLATLGADLVGMLTVLEAIAARHLGAEVLAISLVTNPAGGPGRGEAWITPTWSRPGGPLPTGWAPCWPRRWPRTT